MCQTLLDACDAYLPALGPEARKAVAEALCTVDSQAVAWALVELVNARADPAVGVDDDVRVVVRALTSAKTYSALLKTWVHMYRGRTSLPAISDDIVELVVPTRSGGITSVDGFRTVAGFFRTPQITVERVFPVMRKSTPPPVVGGTLLQEFQ